METPVSSFVADKDDDEEDGEPLLPQDRRRLRLSGHREGRGDAERGDPPVSRRCRARRSKASDDSKSRRLPPASSPAGTVPAAAAGSGASVLLLLGVETGDGAGRGSSSQPTHTSRASMYFMNASSCLVARVGGVGFVKGGVGGACVCVGGYLTLMGGVPNPDALLMVGKYMSTGKAVLKNHTSKYMIVLHFSLQQSKKKVTITTVLC